MEPAPTVATTLILGPVIWESNGKFTSGKTDECRVTDI
jgi:hypothetical protein